jgi:formiminotetrahydrofolate cyclodeaminase
MRYKTQSLAKYLDDLSARLPAPGGGSACALNAAMAAALLSMVVNFTIDKPRYALFKKELKATLVKSEKLRKEFLRLVDLDVAAFKSGDIKKSLAVPLEVARLSARASKLCLPLLAKGNSNLASDIGVAAVFLESAFTAARFNVEINLKALGDAKLSRKTKNELDRMYGPILKMRKTTEAGLGKIIRR